MKFLFNSKDATITNSKSFDFSLTKQIPHSKQLTVENVTFTLKNYTSSPASIYLRSKNIQRALRQKHSVTVRSSDRHDDQNDIIGFLEESHEQYRYFLRNPIRYTLNDTPLRDIDFYFLIEGKIYFLI